MLTYQWFSLLRVLFSYARTTGAWGSVSTWGLGDEL
jgi:hypothetical protein